MNKMLSISILNVGVLALTACGNSSVAVPQASLPVGTLPNTPNAVTCTAAQKLLRSAKDYVIEVNVPSDFDRAASPAPTPTTKIAYTVMLPERCPEQVFPVIVQSHGYSGTRQKVIDADGVVTQTRHFPQIDEIVTVLPWKGYVVISYDERGHGDSKPANGGGFARIIDPEAEVADARAILDWAWDNSIQGGNGAEKLPIQTEHTRTGIAKDMRIGTLGLSYGGGFQFPLTALDDRIDTIVPNGTWHNLMYSLLPGDATKNGFVGLLCVLAIQGGVVNTPIVKTACELLGPTNANANNIRTRKDLARGGAAPATATAEPVAPAPAGAPIGNPAAAQSRTFTEQEVVDLFFKHGSAYFKNLEQNQMPYPGRSAPFKLRAVPTLLIQGNRDSLFNLTDAYWNYIYFKDAGAADVRIVTTEGGHMNPFAFQLEGSVDCGRTKMVDAIFAWYDEKLKGIPSATVNAIPSVCISVSDTPAANTLPAAAAVNLTSFPIGSLTGLGALPAVLPTANVAVSPANVETNPAFVSVVTVPMGENDFVLAGIPTVDKVVVSAGSPGSTVTPVAYVGVGIRRGGNTILVDQQLTSLVNGEHTNNRNLRQSDNTKVLLAGIGEKLRAGDQVGLVFYCAHVQYQSVGSASTASGGAGASGQTNPAPVSPPNATACVNNHAVAVTNVALPILKTGVYPGATLN